MTAKIASQIQNINNSLDWIKKNKPADYEQKFLLLVEERRKLRKLQIASKDNPAIAAYGVSQVGKSYLMNCILQKEGKPFLIEANGKTYKFIEQMNPKTDNTEATGVVTRFTSFSKDKSKYSEEHPILMRCLSVADVILVLSDGYYNDISDYSTYSESEIEKLAKEIYDKYKSMPVIQGNAISADDILDIRAYYKKHVNNAQAFLHTSFFDLLALVADRIPEKDWINVFSILWQKSEYQTKLFEKMLKTLSDFHYAEYVYLPAQALLHDGINENTVMSVQCLNELFLDSPKHFTDVYLRNDETYTKVANLTKSEVCAVCAEIIVKIGEDYINSSSSYSLANINDSRIQDILSSGRTKVEKYNKKRNTTDTFYETTINVLKENDMLDFPGARSRKKELLATLQENTILINVLLRGKVAYLFNMYNESKFINILLYCHHAAQNDVNDIPLLLNDWIMNYVGRTIEERRNTLELTDGISPLFYIGTKFNMDMQMKPEEIANSINSLNGRWQQRFDKVLYQQCFNADGSLDAQKNKIFLNWTKKGECFSNSYILRDFKFSGPLASKLYDNERTDESEMTIPESYYQDMRNTFCSNEAVKRLFPDPELAWDVCASIDNDGSLYIIEQLNKVASKMEKTREDQFDKILTTSIGKVLNAIAGYYVPTDSNEILEKNIKAAKAIFREMDFTCNSDNYYFGHLIHALQTTETAVYRSVHKIMQSPDLNEDVNAFKDYEIIHNSCAKQGHSIENAAEEEDKWACIIATYGFATKEEASDFLRSKGIDIQKLFSGAFKRKQNSCIIADTVFDKWCSAIKSAEFLKEFATDNSFDSGILSSLVDALVTQAKVLNMRDLMANAIAEYVNVVNIHTANESLLADILANMINSFVLDFGFRWQDEKEIEKARAICEKQNLPAFNYILKKLPDTCEEADLTAMFNEMSSNPKAILPSFDDNYNKWLEYMFISFVAHLDVPDYDKEANDQLSSILESIKSK